METREEKRREVRGVSVSGGCPCQGKRIKDERGCDGLGSRETPRSPEQRSLGDKEEEDAGGRRSKGEIVS